MEWVFQQLNFTPDLVILFLRSPKQQVALEAGFSESTARVPKSIENKLGFKLAMAQLAGETANIAMKLMFELQVRDLGELSNKELIQFLEAMSRAHERFSPKFIGNS